MMMRVLRATPEGGGEGDNKSDAREWIDNWREKNDSDFVENIREDTKSRDDSG